MKRQKRDRSANLDAIPPDPKARLAEALVTTLAAVDDLEHAMASDNWHGAEHAERRAE